MLSHRPSPPKNKKWLEKKNHINSYIHMHTLAEALLKWQQEGLFVPQIEGYKGSFIRMSLRVSSKDYD